MLYLVRVQAMTRFGGGNIFPPPRVHDITRLWAVNASSTLR